MGTITEIFLNHVNTLKQLKKRVLLLKGASDRQVDQGHAWDHIAAITKTLEDGCEYLSVEKPKIYDDEGEKYMKINLAFPSM
jgi:hypothetical protein